MIHVMVKEFNSYLNSLIAYVVIGVFLTAMGLLMWVFPETSVLDSDYAGMDALFSLGPYVFMFLVPAITMRSLSEEQKLGTIEFLLTKPLTDWDILFGKFLASAGLVFFALLPTTIYYLAVFQLGNPPGNIDSSGVAGSYVGLLLLGCVFCAIGIAASAGTKNQIVAFILAAFLCFLFYEGFNSMASIPALSGYALFIKQCGLQDHYASIGRGMIDSRDVIYFISVAAGFLFVAKTITGSRSW